MDLNTIGILLILIEILHGFIGDLFLNDMKKFPMIHISFSSIPVFGFALSLVYSDISKDTELTRLQILLFVLSLFYMTYQLVKEGHKCFAISFILFFAFIGLLIFLYRKFKWTPLVGVAAFILLDVLLCFALLASPDICKTHETNYLTLLLQGGIQITAFLQSMEKNNIILTVVSTIGIVELILIFLACLCIKKNTQDRKRE